MSVENEDKITSYIDLNTAGKETDAFLKMLNDIYAAYKKVSGSTIQLGGAETIKTFSAAAKAAATDTDALEKAKKRLAATETQAAKDLALTNAQIKENTANLKLQAQLQNAVAGSMEYAKLKVTDLGRQLNILNITTEAGKKKQQELIAELDKLNAFITKNTDAQTAQARNIGNYPKEFKTLGETGKQAFEKIHEGFKDVAKDIIATGVAFIGIRGIFDFGKESIEAFEAIESEGKRLENALKNLGASAKDIALLKGSLLDLSKAFPYLTATDITKLQQKLITYGKLTSEQIKELSPTIINYAAQQRVSVEEATDTFTKALEGNARGLKTLGINTKDAKTEGERFILIQTELARRVKGAGDVFAETGEGKIATYKARLTEVKQKIGSELLPVYAEFLSGSISLLKAVSAIDFGSIIKGLAVLTGLWVTYRAVVVGVNIVNAFKIASMVAERAITEGVTLAKAAETLAEETNGKVKNANTVLTYLLVGAQKAYAAITKLATFEVTLFNTAIKISPLGLFLTVLGAAVVLFSSFSASAASSSQGLAGMKERMEATNEVTKKANETLVGQKEALEELVKKVEDHNLKLGDRKKALEELIELDPKYLSGLTLQNIETEKGAAILDKYVEALQRKAFAEAAEQRLVELSKEQLDLDADRLTAQEKLNNAKKDQQKIDAEKSTDKEGHGLEQFGAHIEVNDLNGSIKDLDNKGEALKRKIDTIKQLIKNAGATDAEFNQKSGLGKGNHTTADDTTDADEAAKSAAELHKFLLELDDKLAKAKREHAAEELKRIADDAQFVIDDNRNTLDARLKAFDIYTQAKAAVINRDAESEIVQEKKKLEEIARINKKNPQDLTDEEDKVRHTYALVTQTILNLEQKRDNLQYDLAKKNEKLREDIIKTAAERDETLRLEKYNKEKELDQLLYTDELVRLTESYNKAFQAAQGNVRKQEKLASDFNAKKLELQDKFLVDSLNKDIAFAEKELEIEKALSTNTPAEQARIISDEKKLTDLKLKLKEAETKYIIDKNNDQKKSEEEVYKTRTRFLTSLKDISDKVFSTIGKAIDGHVNSQKANLQSQSDELDKNTQRAIDAENSTGDAADVKAKKIAVINARAQAQKEVIAQRERKLDHDKAVFDKARGIFEITLNTAMAVSKALFEGGPIYAAVVGALGLAELITAISTPIPKLKDGTRDSKAGLHILGDGGKKELAVLPDGRSFISPSKDTLYDLPAHTVVYPDADKLINAALNISSKPLANMPLQSGAVDYERIYTKVGDKIINAINSKQEIHWHWQNGELIKSIKNGNDWTHYIQNNI